jgi:hypothetical protein
MLAVIAARSVARIVRSVAGNIRTAKHLGKLLFEAPPLCHDIPADGSGRRIVPVREIDHTSQKKNSSTSTIH